MKLKCPCGKVIHDGTDGLSYKGHIVPDEELFPNFDQCELLLDRVAEKGCVGETDFMDLRKIWAGWRAIYQCPECGRIFVWDRDLQKTFIFAPEEKDINKALLPSLRSNQEMQRKGKARND